MIIRSTLMKNNSYGGVRLTIVGSQSGDSVYYYTEGSGDRYYYANQEGDTLLESASFQSYFSFTMSNAQTFTFDLIPMIDGNSVMIDTKIVGVNQNGDKSYMATFFGGYMNDGTNLYKVGGDMTSTVLSDFTSVLSYFTQSGTSSVLLSVTGEYPEVIDFDVYVSYTKGYHNLGGWVNPIEPPIYPPPPSYTPPS